MVCSLWLSLTLPNRIMATIQKFEDLESWQKARSLNQPVYPLTFKEPIANDVRFKNQIRGTCGSIMNNIAEGFERSSKLEFINSLTISKDALEKLKSQLYRGLDNKHFTSKQFSEICQLAHQITKMITAFINYLNKSEIKGQTFKERI